MFTSFGMGQENEENKNSKQNIFAAYALIG